MPSDHQARAGYLRQRLLTRGAESLTPQDSLEFLLCYCMPYDKAVVAVKRLFERFHSISAILNADPIELSSVEGVNDSAVLLLGLLPKVHALCATRELPKDCMDNLESCMDYVSKHFEGIYVEQFKIFCFDDNFGSCVCKTPVSGNPSSVRFSMEKIVEPIMAASSRYVIIAHNHPSGSCTPSPEDIASTVYIKEALLNIGIYLIDHIVVGRDGAISIMRSGEFPQFDPSESERIIAEARKRKPKRSAKRSDIKFW